MRIFDNGGESIDRYTLITKLHTIYTFDEDPYHPQGFGQYCGEWDSRYPNTFDHLGKEIKCKDLPPQAQRFVRERIRS